MEFYYDVTVWQADRRHCDDDCVRHCAAGSAGHAQADRAGRAALQVSILLVALVVQLFK